MKHILLLGATGHLGSVVLQELLDKNYFVTILVRNAQKILLTHKNLKVLEGNVTDAGDVTKALLDIDVVISTLGHGFRTSYPIQEKTLQILLPFMKKNSIQRFVTVTGAGLTVKDDPHSFIAVFLEKVFSLIDPYRIQDARNQQILLEKSDLNWTVVRTPIHSEGTNKEIAHVGFVQPPLWNTLPRVAIANFIIESIEKDQWSKKAPIIY